ncbi:alpha/beta fold hydrolase [Promicromonospora sp. NPDC060204]|uniref:alpha/beta fold hydrolase n=1 Tax=Promicromonospora sp. NPDC060204 TaxID=3347071 RepID=UPI0036666CD3
MNSYDLSAAITHRVTTTKGQVQVTEHPGEEPAIVMTHGFPDDSRIYQHLLPELQGRRAVTFDFLGYGKSGRDATWPLETGQREEELGAVLGALDLDKPVLVGHDIGGPVVIRYALANPTKVGGLVLLNTFFGDSPTLEFPEFIRFLADPHLAHLADDVIADPSILGWMLTFTDKRLNPGPPNPAGLGALAILPQFYGDQTQPDSIAAIRAWTADLFPAIAEQNEQIATGELAALDIPVTIAFGVNDPYLNAGVAEHLHELFPRSVVHTIADAAHWPQWDQPAATAVVITGT